MYFQNIITEILGEIIWIQKIQKLCLMKEITSK